MADEEGKVSINSCSFTELTKVPGLAPMQAGVILDIRSEHGNITPELFEASSILNEARGLLPKFDFTPQATGVRNPSGPGENREIHRSPRVAEQRTSTPYARPSWPGLEEGTQQGAYPYGGNSLSVGDLGGSMQQPLEQGAIKPLAQDSTARQRYSNSRPLPGSTDSREGDIIPNSRFGDIPHGGRASTEHRRDWKVPPAAAEDHSRRHPRGKGDPAMRQGYGSLPVQGYFDYGSCDVREEHRPQREWRGQPVDHGWGSPTLSRVRGPSGLLNPLRDGPAWRAPSGGRDMPGEVFGRLSYQPLPKSIAFDGLGNWRTFHRKFTTFADDRGWDSVQRLDQLVWSLDGKGGDYLGFLLDRDPDQDYYSLVGKLAKRFDYHGLPESAQLAFASAKQGPEESLTEWTDRVLGLFPGYSRIRPCYFCCDFICLLMPDVDAVHFQ